MTINIPSVAITIPVKYTSYNNTIEAAATTGYQNEITADFSLSRYVLESMALAIARQEMSEIKEKIELEKVNEMLNSNDKEMNNLAFNILKEHTKYAGRIYESIKWGYNLDTIVEEFTRNNRLNLMSVR